MRISKIIELPIYIRKFYFFDIVLKLNNFD